MPITRLSDRGKAKTSSIEEMFVEAKTCFWNKASAILSQSSMISCACRALPLDEYASLHVSADKGVLREGGGTAMLVTGSVSVWPDGHLVLDGC